MAEVGRVELAGLLAGAGVLAVSPVVVGADEIVRRLTGPAGAELASGGEAFLLGAWVAMLAPAVIASVRAWWAVAGDVRREPAVRCRRRLVTAAVAAGWAIALWVVLLRASWHSLPADVVEVLGYLVAAMLVIAAAYAVGAIVVRALDPDRGVAWVVLGCVLAGVALMALVVALLGLSFWPDLARSVRPPLTGLPREDAEPVWVRVGRTWTASIAGASLLGLIGLCIGASRRW